ncbi:hypothetical protein [Acinetobacter sp. Marseille-P8610]|uniref:hypothetical protein n=1 Tax=Acinetobacter sp. Marseille-P8610 TaxID=2864459 RepID=UPI001CE3F1E5|nr:hypothetical protein [Acinetobacter sp. Marseille-P8610]
MNNILNAQDAFNALRAGKTILCRHILGEFDSLDQFPATVFALPEHEFCIQIELVELAGFKFTKPIALEDVKPDQDLFVIQPHGVIYHYTFDNSDLLADCIINGFAQRDAENAELHLKALCKFLSYDYFSIEHTNIQIIDKRNDVDHWETNNHKDTSLDDILGPVNDQMPPKLEVEEINTPSATIDYKPKQKRQTKKDKEVQAQIEHNKDLVIDAIATCLTAEEVETTCFGLDKNGFNDAQQEQIIAAKLAKLEQLAQEKAAAESEDHELFNQDKSEPELSVLCEAFIDEIKQANSPANLNAVHGRINTSNGLEDYEHKVLAKHLEEKSASFVAEQPPVDTANEQKNTERKPIEEDEERYQEKLITLKKYVDGAQTPAEVNAAVKYTNSWSAKQREPLIKYMHTRLETLQNEKAATQPSLMVQIQNAPDLTTLDALEIDVSSIDPVAQPEMMRYVRARRAELEQAAPSTSIDEDLP